MLNPNAFNKKNRVPNWVYWRSRRPSWQPRGEEALADAPDLVRDLALLPAECRRAGEGIDEIVPAHLQEAPIVEPVLADEDRLHRRLHVVVDAARAGAPEEGEGPVVASKTISCVSRMGRDVSQGEA